MNRRAELLPFDPSFDSAYDRYAFIRDAWLQRREYQVRDGEVPGGEITPEELEELERDTQEPEGSGAPEAPDVQPPPAPTGASSSATSLMPASEAIVGGMFR